MMLLNNKASTTLSSARRCDAAMTAARRGGGGLVPRRPFLRVAATGRGPEGEQKEGKDVTDAGSVKEAYRGVMGAPSAPAFTAPPLVPAFTRRREVQVGRWAMIGIAAAAAWEIALPSHPGPIGVTAALTGWSVPTVQLLYAAFVAHGVFGLLWPGAPTFDRRNVVDYNRRPEGPPTEWANPLAQPAKFFGSSPGFGFTKKNELLHGRLAALGFLAALVNEAYTGLGPVGQVAWWLGATQPSDAWYSQAGSVLVAFAALMTALAYASGRGGTFEGEDDIY